MSTKSRVRILKRRTGRPYNSATALLVSDGGSHISYAAYANSVEQIYCQLHSDKAGLYIPIRER